MVRFQGFIALTAIVTAWLVTWSAALSPEVGYGYSVTSVNQSLNGKETTIFLKLIQSTNTYGKDIEQLRVHVSYETSDRIHVHITNKDASNSRWEVPQELIPRKKASPPLLETSVSDGATRRALSEYPASGQNTNKLKISFTTKPFGFAVTRKSTKEVLFNSTPDFSSASVGNMVFKDQYLEISTALPEEASLYGFGENTQSDGLRLKHGQSYTLWASDIPSTNTDVDLYGAHPFYMDVRKGGTSHGVLLLNSNGMDVSYQSDGLTYKAIGGILDFYFFAGPEPLSVMQQYTELIGRPAPMPYWSLGFHQCRYGYKNVEDLEAVVANYQKENIPLEVIWNDIDYMDEYRDFTVDPINYPADKFRAFLDKIHANNQRYVLIVDPGINTQETYSTFLHGRQKDIFLKRGGQPYLAQVWPGPVYFPDFFHPNIDSFWATEISKFHNIIPFDGMWIDMNEASNFCFGTTCSYPTNGTCPGPNDIGTCCLACSQVNVTRWDDPPYKINSGGIHRTIGNKSIATSTIHHNGILEYDAHNLYGFSEAVVTFRALKSLLKKRPFLLSRSTFPGIGAYVAHWTGDNAATWNDLAYSLVGVMNSGIFGVPMAGADICGFLNDTWEELCNRWTQVGAFYPFSRNHADINSQRQEPYLWESVAQSARKALGLRYRLLPYFYTLVFEAHSTGAPIARPLFFSFSDDPRTLAIGTQFLLGKGVLVSPVLSPGKTSVTAYFPKGTWYNLFTLSQVVHADFGSYQTLPAPLDTINVHVYEGTILPMQNEALTTTAARKTPFSLLIAFPLVESSSDYANGELFLDDGEDLEMEIKPEKSTFIKFEATRSNGNVHVASHVTFGEFALKQGWILQDITILGVTGDSFDSLFLNGKPAPLGVRIQSHEGHSMVKFSGLSFPIGTEFELNCKAS